MASAIDLRDVGGRFIGSPGPRSERFARFSCVAELCCSTAPAIVDAMLGYLRRWCLPISLIAATNILVAPCIPEM